MKIRLSIRLDITRKLRPEPEHRDNDGTLAERAEPHPVGFVPYHEQPIRPDERAR